MTRDVSAALLLRDASRASRRWQTYGARAAFSATLFGIVLATIWGVTHSDLVDPADLGWAGRGIFVAFAVVQVLLAATFAPFAVARAIIEEREEDTLDVLILTRLQARQILLAKIAARILVLLTVILGALPVLGLVVSLGGVSIVEVVAITMHAVTAVLVLGAMGGFFAIFTRSPVVATLAALAYAVPAFALMPLLYAVLTGDWKGMAHFSPLLGTTARDWWSLLPLVSYLPVLGMVLLLGARFYELRVSHARLRRFFSTEAWSGRAVMWGTLALVTAAVTILPFASAASWIYSMRALGSGASLATWEWLVLGPARVVVWAWCVGLLLLGSWLFLRIAMDMVMMADDLLGPRTGRAARDKRPVVVWGNPVAWRELKGRSWAVTAPTIGMWLLMLLGIFQMGIWIIPGGLLGVGGLNAAAALVLTLWLATGTIERERRSGSLEILLTSTMGSFPILWGKTLGTAVPTLALLLLSLPMLVLGAPHLHVLFAGDSVEGYGLATLKGVLAFGWVGALWLLTLCGSTTLALALRNPRAAYGIGLVGLGLGLLVPATLAAFLRDAGWLSAPLRLLVPVLVTHPTIWEILLSTALLGLAALSLFVLSCVKLRTWGLRE